MNNINKVHNLLLANNIDAYLINDIYNLKYIFGVGIETGLGFITPKSCYLITDGRYITQIKEDKINCEIILTDYLNLKEIISDLISTNNIKTLGYEPSKISYLDYLKYSDLFKNLLLIDIESHINHLRAIKSSYEIDCIREAENIVSCVFDDILSIIKPGVTEKDIALEIEYKLKKNGADKTSFDTILVSGSNTSKPHGMPGNRKIKSKDIITMDFGCVYKGYCSDMTRTVFVGAVSDEYKKIYNIVDSASRLAFENIKDGVIGSDIDKVSRDYIKSFGFDEYFVHGLGHSLGLEIHENPRFSPKCNDVINKGMILSVEPGIYIPNEFGIRIEDIVLVKDSGIENLTNATRQILVL